LQSILNQSELIEDEARDRQEDKKRAAKKKKKVEKAAEESIVEEPAAESGARFEVDKELMHDPVYAKVIEEEEGIIKEQLGINDKSQEITIEEIEALESLAFESSVEKERQTLETIKQEKELMNIETMLMAGRIGGPKPQATDMSTGFALSKLDQMLDSLEAELESVETSIGDRLNVLDQDGDGVVSTEELRYAIKEIFKTRQTDEEVERFIQKIDSNCDGIVTVEELREFRELAQEKLEVSDAADLHEEILEKDKEISAKM